MYETVVGRRSLTNVAIVSIRGLTSKELVRRLKQRLAEIDIDGMVSPASATSRISLTRAGLTKKTHWLSPERADARASEKWRV